MPTQFYIDSIYSNFLRLLEQDNEQEHEVHLSRNELVARFPHLLGQTLFEGMSWSVETNANTRQFTFRGHDSVTDTTKNHLDNLLKIQKELFGDS